MNKRIFLTLVCAVLLLLSLVQITCIVKDSIQENAEFEELAQNVNNGEEQTAERADSTALSVPSSDADQAAEILRQYQALHEENPDFAGWIQIQGTKLDYPVMYTPDAPEYYLHRAFDRSDSASGTPFIGQGCSPDPQSDNLILYGHNMRNKTMFATLLAYRDEAFWRDHPSIRFDTLNKTGEYEVLAAFPIDVTPNNGHFAFYEEIDFETADERQGYVERCKQLSLYETGVNAGESEHLLTLVTCSYHDKNGRFVVVAREKSTIQP